MDWRPYRRLARCRLKRRLYSDHLRAAALAADDLRNHLRDYADGTDEPVPAAVEAADWVDVVVDLLAEAAP